MSTPTDDLEAKAREAAEQAAKRLNAEVYAALPKPVNEPVAEIVARRIGDWKDGYAKGFAARSVAHPPTSELVEAGKELICTHNGFEAIKNALHRASARIGCPPGDNADADLYRELSHAAESVSRLSAHPKEVAPTVEAIMEVVKDWEENELGMLPDWDKLRARLTKLLTTP